MGATAGVGGGGRRIHLTRMDQGKEKMESPPRLGLGTIYIVPFMERQIYYQSMCLEFRYEDGKVLGTQRVDQLPLIVSYVLILLKAHPILSF